MDSTYFLVAHGSRDPRPQVALEKLARLLGDRYAEAKGLRSSDLTNQAKDANKILPFVGTGTLELAATSLNEQIRQFGDRTRSLGLKQVHLIPLFLQPGVHVKEDIPREVAIAKLALGSAVTINLLPHLGSHPGLSQLLARKKASVAADAWILLAHGSSRNGGNQPIEDMACQLGALSAYWSVPPSLEKRVTELVATGRREIGILPYFLFAGGITDAIAQSVANFSKQFPGVNFYLAEPLGATAELADLIVDLIRNN